MTTDPVELAPSDDEPIELAEVLNTAFDKGVVAHGEVTIAVADVDLVKLNIGLLLSAIETMDRRLEASGGTPDGTSRGTNSPAATLSSVLRTPLGPPVASIQPGRSEAREAVSEATKGGPTAAGHGETSGAAIDVASLADVAQGLPERIHADAAGVESGLARLVLTLIEVLRKVLEHQAVRRMDGGTLTPAEVERLGLALSRLHDRMQELQRVFGLSPEDLQIDLGPLGRLR